MSYWGNDQTTFFSLLFLSLLFFFFCPLVRFLRGISKLRRLSRRENTVSLRRLPRCSFENNEHRGMNRRESRHGSIHCRSTITRDTRDLIRTTFRGEIIDRIWHLARIIMVDDRLGLLLKFVVFYNGITRHFVARSTVMLFSLRLNTLHIRLLFSSCSVCAFIMLDAVFPLTIEHLTETVPVSVNVNTIQVGDVSRNHASGEWRRK